MRVSVSRVGDPGRTFSLDGPQGGECFRKNSAEYEVAGWECLRGSASQIAVGAIQTLFDIHGGKKFDGEKVLVAD